MIGGAGHGASVLGYAFAALDEASVKSVITPFDTRLGANGQTFTQRLDALQQEIRRVIVALKGSEKALKDGLEQRKDTKLASLKGDSPALEDLRRQYLMNEYVPELRGLGMSVAKVESAIKQSQLYKNLSSAVNGLPAPVMTTEGAALPFLEVKGGKVTLGYKVQKVVKRSATLVELLTSAADAYIPVTGGAATQRQVYRKKTFNNYYTGPETEYVLDDDDIYTRRYGYASKDRTTLEMLFDDGLLRGKYAKGKPLPSASDKLAKDPNIFKQQPSENLPKIGDKSMTTRQMLHVHQELGSGDSQRGTCLASTPRRNMVSNQGVEFAGITIKVDLARVPTGKELLYNLYRPEAQAKAEATTIRKYDKKSDKTVDFADKQHMLDSVSKNREVFLRVLLPEFLANKDEVLGALGRPTT